MARSALVQEPIEPGRILAEVGDAADGATLLFLGVVRDHADGRAVRGVRYEAYEDMARGILAEIVDEACRLLGTDRIAVVHRVGDLSVGEVSVAVAVSSPHRSEAYQASRYVIEQIKERLPVWKKEGFAGGGEAWVEGTEPRPGPGSRSRA